MSTRDRGLEPIPLCVPRVAGNEGAYLLECLETNYVSSVGPFVDRFERDFAAAVGARHAVATSSGTAALHVALLLAGVRPGDEVLVPSLTFIAPANAVRYVGAHPVFIDVDPGHWQMNPASAAEFLERRCGRASGSLVNLESGRPVTAVLPVHLLGHAAPMAEIGELAGRHDLAIVEDATESLGATYRGRKLGSSGNLSCFSFNGNKLITTGGGGMITTDDPALARRAKYLTTQAKTDPIEFIHGEVGFNYRLTNIQAAVGCAQLECLDEYLAAKRRIALRYAGGLANIPGLTLPAAPGDVESAWWLYTVRVGGIGAALDRRELLTRLAERGIEARPLWQPMHLSPAHAGSIAMPCEAAEEVHASALSLPSSTGLTESDQTRVVNALRDIFGTSSPPAGD